MKTNYYLTQSGNALCSDCAEESELESGRPLKERKNTTGESLESLWSALLATKRYQASRKGQNNAAADNYSQMLQGS